MSSIHVLQLIDTLHTGGAEKLAVNLSNQLAATGFSSHIGVTRDKGPLHKTVDSEVQTACFQKRGRFDLRSYKRLVRYIKDHKIELVHAHGPSVYQASACKYFTDAKLVWHVHHGHYQFTKPGFFLQLIKKQIDHVITVNEELRLWVIKELNFPEESVTYLPNFVEEPKQLPDDHAVNLPGQDGFRILNIANFRPEKNQLNLLRSFLLLQTEFSNLSLIMVGKVNGSDYSENIKDFIKDHNLDQSVFILGPREDIPEIISNSVIGVISSDSEGLPMTLLEFGINGLPVISTAVGHCPKVLKYGQYGRLVPANDPQSLSVAIKEYLNDIDSAQKVAELFKQHVENNYSAKAAMPVLHHIYQKAVSKG